MESENLQPPQQQPPKKTKEINQSTIVITDIEYPITILSSIDIDIKSKEQTLFCITKFRQNQRIIIIKILKQTTTTKTTLFVTKPTVHILTDEHVECLQGMIDNKNYKKIRLGSQIMSCVVFIKYNHSLLHFNGTKNCFYEISTTDGNGRTLILPDSSNFFYHHSDSVFIRLQKKNEEDFQPVFFFCISISKKYKE